ncbi:hypothetical protein QJS10_CPB22g00393 [Acorus calamus]|uniref:Uncharacterized protein n=1 Tax=Acorus calamus TaxID=4465 RepID=A0AAV9BZ80_ACOCL|nr:hypothetical protein QJS10_CPB22g00393 [Acorus calamus]
MFPYCSPVEESHTRLRASATRHGGRRLRVSTRWSLTSGHKKRAIYKERTVWLLSSKDYAAALEYGHEMQELAKTNANAQPLRRSNGWTQRRRLEDYQSQRGWSGRGQRWLGGGIENGGN